MRKMWPNAVGAAFADWFAGDGVAFGERRSAGGGECGDCQILKMVTQGLSAHLDPDGWGDGVLGRYGLHMGAFRGAQQGCKWQSSGDVGALHYDLARKQPGMGVGEVALDAGANDAPTAGDCCKLPGPGN